jgi:murein DD-endopeptidase MepM/ murein hydrolase activator NlpD
MMKRLLTISLVALIAASAFTRPLSSRAAAPLMLKITTRARAMRQGEVVLVTVTPSRDVSTVEAGAFANPIALWHSAGRTWQGLIGIPVTAETGRRDLVVHAANSDSDSLFVRISLQVGRTNFAVRKLTVDDKFADPPESEVDRILSEAKRLDALFATTKGGRLWSGPWRLPVPGTPTSSFGRETFLNGEERGRHQGADFHAASGTPIHAPNAGVVALAEPLYFSGNTVILDHGDGLYSLFAHLSKTNVAVGAKVARGDVLGEVGATGRVTGPHLHWAVRLHDVSVDPLSLVHAVAEIDPPAAATSHQ